MGSLQTESLLWRQAQTTRWLVYAGEVEQDIGLHRCEQREASDLGGLVQELGAGNLAIFALGARSADNELYQVHLLDQVLEGADVCV